MPHRATCCPTNVYEDTSMAAFSRKAFLAQWAENDAVGFGNHVTMIADGPERGVLPALMVTCSFND